MSCVYPLQKTEPSLEPLLIVKESLRRTSSGWGNKALAWAIRRHGFPPCPDPGQLTVSVGLSFLSSGKLALPVALASFFRMALSLKCCVILVWRSEPLLWGHTDLDLNSVSGMYKLRDTGKCLTSSRLWVFSWTMDIVLCTLKGCGKIRHATCKVLSIAPDTRWDLTYGRHHCEV